MARRRDNPMQKKMSQMFGYQRSRGRTRERTRRDAYNFFRRKSQGGMGG